jgi:hypothetical protein
MDRPAKKGSIGLGCQLDMGAELEYLFDSDTVALEIVITAQHIVIDPSCARSIQRNLFGDPVGGIVLRIHRILLAWLLAPSAEFVMTLLM